ncbi:membrane hypothetical protein [Frankia sp. AiPs1]
MTSPLPQSSGVIVGPGGMISDHVDGFVADAAVGAGVALALFGVLRVLGRGRGGLGLGDVKLVGLLGAGLGWTRDLSLVLLALGLGVLSAGLWAAFLVVTGRACRSDALSYGPHLLLGALLALLLGGALDGLRHATDPPAVGTPPCRPGWSPRSTLLPRREVGWLFVGEELEQAQAGESVAGAGGQVERAGLVEDGLAVWPAAVGGPAVVDAVGRVVGGPDHAFLFTVA